MKEGIVVFSPCPGLMPANQVSEGPVVTSHREYRIVQDGKEMAKGQVKDHSLHIPEEEGSSMFSGPGRLKWNLYVPALGRGFSF